MTRDEALRKLAAGEKLDPAIERYYRTTDPKLKNRFKIVLPIVRLWRQMVGTTNRGQ